MARQRKTLPSDDDLDEPLEPLKLGILMSDEEVRLRITQRSEAELKKLHQLCIRHGIQDGPSKWFALALALARKHEPGFQDLKRPGRHSKWTQLRLWILAGEVCCELESGAPSKAEAARRLAEREPWMGLLQADKWSKGRGVGKWTDRDPSKVLLEQLKAMNDRDLRVGEDHYRMVHREGGLEAWRARVSEFLK